MLNSLLSTSISSIKIRKINQLNNIYSPSNENSSALTHFINSNKRFNNEEETKRDKSLIEQKIKIIKLKLNKKNRSKYRSKSEFYLPKISTAGKNKKQNSNKKSNNKNNFGITKKCLICKINNINNNIKPKDFVIKKLFENKNKNKNKNRELMVNPVSINLNNSSGRNISIFKRKNIKKDDFIKRVKNYKQLLKEELFDYSNSNNYSNLNISENRLQSYINDRNKDKENNTNIYLNNKVNIYNVNNFRKNANNGLYSLHKKVIKCNYIFNKPRKFQFYEEINKDKYKC